MKKYIPHLVIALILFFAGRFSKDDSSKEIKAKWEAEREILFTAITQKDAHILRLDQQSEDIYREMNQYIDLYQDSLKAQQRATIHFKKLYEKINLRNASVPELDSLRKSLLPKPLYTP